jgi:nucleoside-triphosphatase THEP1
MAEHPSNEWPSAAAIEVDGQVDVDALLAAVTDRLRRSGWRVRGLLMTYPEEGEGCARPMVLVDVDSREPYLVSQPLGRDSRACRADPQGFARASSVLRRAADEAPDLVICNRFGGLEAEGGGFRAELLDILARGLPLLTTVASRHVEAWQRFTGGAPVLPAHADAVDAWLKGLPAAAAVRDHG